MHRLRTSSLLARLVLAWFACVLGVAAASPLLHPRPVQPVCTAGGGTKWVVLDEDGRAMVPGHHTLDCPLCLIAGAPPPSSPASAGTSAAWAEAPDFRVAAHLPAAWAGAPLPARGPPSGR